MTTPVEQPPVHRPETLPADASWLFPEYDFATMNPEDHAGVIIERILERGSWEQVR